MRIFPVVKKKRATTGSSITDSSQRLTFGSLESNPPPTDSSSTITSGPPTGVDVNPAPDELLALTAGLAELAGIQTAQDFLTATAADTGAGQSEGQQASLAAPEANPTPADAASSAITASSTETSPAPGEATLSSISATSAESSPTPTDAASSAINATASDSSTTPTEASSFTVTAADANALPGDTSSTGNNNQSSSDTIDIQTEANRLSSSLADSSATPTEASLASIVDTETDTNATPTEARNLTATFTDSSAAPTDAFTASINVTDTDANATPTEAHLLVAATVAESNATPTEAMTLKVISTDSSATPTEATLSSINVTAADSNATPTEARTLTVTTVADANAAPTDSSSTTTVGFLTPTFGSVGTFSGTASNVAASTNLFPGVPASTAAGDLLVILTESTSTTASVATPTGWTKILDVTPTNGRIVMFAKVAGASESAPTVAWTSLTNGASGTPAYARMARFTNVDTSNLATMVDVTGTASNAVAATSTAAGGSAITTLQDKDLVFVIGERKVSGGVTYGLTTPQDGITWTQVVTDNFNTSGAGMGGSWWYGVMTPAGSVSAKTFNLTGASSGASSGVIVALKAKPG